MKYREIDQTKDNERVMVMMMMWYRELVGGLQNPLHQSEWPLGIVEKKDMEVKYIGAFDTSPLPPPSQGGKVREVSDVLAGMIGYTTVYYDVHDMLRLASIRRSGQAQHDSVNKPLAIFEIMMFVREAYRGKGIGQELWKSLVKFAHEQGLPLWIGNNTEGGDASLIKAVGAEHVQMHRLTVVPLTHNSPQPSLTLRGGGDKKFPPLKIKRRLGGVMNL